MEKKSSGDESDEAFYMFKENDSLEIHLDTHLVDSASSFNDDHDSIDVHDLNEELSLFCENLLNKYKLLKSKSFKLKKK